MIYVETLLVQKNVFILPYEDRTGECVHTFHVSPAHLKNCSSRHATARNPQFRSARNFA